MLALGNDAFAELRQRIANVEAGDALESELYAHGRASLPVVCLDPMLPRQRFELTSADPTFSRFLRAVGLGGLFAVVGLNFRQKRIRRHGVVVRVEYVDAAQTAPDLSERIPSTVSAFLVAGRRLQVVGPAEQMRRRVGRWRQNYADGEMGGGTALGWGDELFVNAREGEAVGGDDEDLGEVPSSHEAWSELPVQILMEPDEATLFEPRGATSEYTTGSAAAIVADAATLGELLQEWESVVRNPNTYSDSKVVAGFLARGETNPGTVLDKVLKDLGPQPSSSSPTALALWGAALVNPIPSLGVALELRGAVLEAQTAKERLTIVTRGVRRSIANLRGEQPL